MKYLLVSLILCLSSIISLNAQKVSYYGTIKEEGTQFTIPFAHINLVNSPKMGFITNENGEFSFRLTPEKDGKVLVKISCIGYESKTLYLLSNSANTILLQEESKVLKELTITPIDEERLLLQKVIENIPNNYPTWTERLTGKTIEEGFQDKAHQVKYYRVEAEVEADKLDYSQIHHYGNVQINNRSYQMYDAYKSSSIRIISGAHNIHRFDFVKKRLGPLKVNKLNRYELTLIDTVFEDESPLAKLAFVGRAYQGVLFINLINFSIHRGEFTWRKGVDDELSKTHSTSDLSDHRRRYLTFVTDYFFNEGRYHLRFIHYKTGFKASKSGENDFHLSNTFSVNTFERTDELITFKDRSHFSERVLDTKKLAEITEDELDTLRNHTKDEFRSNPKKRTKWKFGFGTSFVVNRMQLQPFQAKLNQPPVAVTSERMQSTSYHIPTYALHGTWQFSNSIKALTDFTFQDNFFSLGLGPQFHFPLTKSGRLEWFSGVRVGYQQIRYRIGKETLSSPLMIEDKTFDTEITIFGEQRGWFSAAQLGLSYRWNQFIFRFDVRRIASLTANTGISILQDDNSGSLNTTRLFINNQEFLQTANALFKGIYQLNLGVFLKY